jgi:hypothetical protein
MMITILTLHALIILGTLQFAFVLIDLIGDFMKLLRKEKTDKSIINANTEFIYKIVLAILVHTTYTSITPPKYEYQYTQNCEY